MDCFLVARGKGSCSSLHARCSEPAWCKSPRELRRVRVTLRAREGPLRRLNEGMRIVLEAFRTAATAAWIVSVLEARCDQTNDRSSKPRRHQEHTLNWSVSCWRQPMQPVCKPKLPNRRRHSRVTNIVSRPPCHDLLNPSPGYKKTKRC